MYVDCTILRISTDDSMIEFHCFANYVLLLLPPRPPTFCVLIYRWNGIEVFIVFCFSWAEKKFAIRWILNVNFKSCKQYSAHGTTLQQKANIIIG